MFDQKIDQTDAYNESQVIARRVQLIPQRNRAPIYHHKVAAICIQVYGSRKQTASITSERLVPQWPSIAALDFFEK